MTFIMFVLGISLVGLTARLLIHAIVLPRIRLSAHIRGLERYGFRVGDGDVSDGRAQLNERVVALVERIGRSVMELAPTLTPLERGDLAAAAYHDVSPDAVHGYRVVAAVFLPVMFAFLFLSSGGFSILTLAVVVLSAVCGWQLPATMVRSRGRKRLDEIDRNLPDLIDLLSATVEAGMGIAQSIGLVSTRFQGALGEELRITQQQQSLGVSNKEALEDMLERVDTPSVRAFVRTVTRGETLGMSIAPILRELAIDVRRRRRQAAQEKMQKAPVKMLFPIMFFIFPALMIVMMFPAAYSLLTGLTGA